MPHLKQALSRRRREISTRQYAECKNTLLKWGFPKNNPLVDQLINVALLKHLKAREAKAAFEEIQNNADCAALIKEVYSSNSAMKRDITIGPNPVNDVINYLRTAIDFGKY